MTDAIEVDAFRRAAAAAGVSRVPQVQEARRLAPIDQALDRGEDHVARHPPPPVVAPGPPPAPGPEDGWGTVPVATSWTPVDLTAVLAGGIVRPATTLLARSDGAHLLYPGRVHLLYGRPESCKSWVALVAVVEAVRAAGRAVIVDLESDATEILPRLFALGLSVEAIGASIDYIQPREPLQSIGRAGSGQADRDLADALDRRPTVIVVDAIGELFALHALDPLSNRDAPAVTTWLRRIAETSGAAVIALDHVPHTTREGGGSAPIGAQHKLAAVTGAAFEVKASRPLAPGKVGEVSLFIAKDRPGAVRAASAGKVAARISLDAQTHDGQVLVTVAADVRSGERSPALLARVIEVRQVLEAAGPDGLSKRAIRTEVRGNNDLTDDAIVALIDDGLLDRRRGRANALQHILITPEANPDEPF